ALLDSLLAYARLQRPVARGEVDCAAVVEQVKADLAARIGQAGATVSVDPLPRVVGDEARIYQLFLNLVSNAIKFHRPGEPPRVSVSATERGREAAFCIADQGLGIDPEHQSVVFGAFRRLHPAKEFEGSGLELTIC